MFDSSMTTGNIARYVNLIMPVCPLDSGDCPLLLVQVGTGVITPEAWGVLAMHHYSTRPPLTQLPHAQGRGLSGGGILGPAPSRSEAHRFFLAVTLTFRHYLNFICNSNEQQ